MMRHTMLKSHEAEPTCPEIIDAAGLQAVAESSSVNPPHNSPEFIYRNEVLMKLA